MRIPFFRRIRHPFYPALKLAAASAGTRDTPALYGSYEDLRHAGITGVRVERAVFPVRGASDPFLTAPERDELWELFQVPIYTLLLDSGGSVIAHECEAQEGLHLKDGYRGGVLFGRVESRLCECGRPGPRLMPAAEWEQAPMVRCAAG